MYSFPTRRSSDLVLRSRHPARSEPVLRLGGPAPLGQLITTFSGRGPRCAFRVTRGEHQPVLGGALDHLIGPSHGQRLPVRPSCDLVTVVLVAWVAADAGEIHPSRGVEVGEVDHH